MVLQTASINASRKLRGKAVAGLPHCLAPKLSVGTVHGAVLAGYQVQIANARKSGFRLTDYSMETRLGSPDHGYFHR